MSGSSVLNYFQEEDKMRKHLVTLLLTFLLVSCVSPPPTIPATNTSFPSTPSITRTPVPGESSAPGEIAFRHIKSIADDIGPRPTGTEREMQTAEYIIASLEAIGYTPDFSTVVNGWLSGV